MAERDWQMIAAEYIEGEESLRALAERYAVPCGTLRGRARREGWAAKRRDARGTKAGIASDGPPAALEEAAASSGGERAAALEKNAESPFGGESSAALEKNAEKSFGGERPAALEKNAEHIFRVTDKLVQRAEELLDGSEIGARELGELMRAIKNAKEIRMLRSALDEREQLARVRSLEEKNEPPKREALRIEFSPEAEEAAK